MSVGCGGAEARSAALVSW